MTARMVSGEGDDPGIGDDETVLRRISEAFVVFDDNLQRLRPSTQAFRQGGTSGHGSVYLLSVTNPEEVSNEGPEPYLVPLRARLLLELGLGIVRDPTSGGPGHCEITGRKTRSVLDRLAKFAQWVEGYAPE